MTTQDKKKVALIALPEKWESEPLLSFIDRCIAFVDEHRETIREALAEPEVETVTVDEICEITDHLGERDEFFEFMSSRFPNGLKIVEDKPPIVEGEK